MKKRIIELMTLFGYEYIKEQPSKRLLFYEPESEETIQIWKKKTIKETELFTAQLIRNRVLNTGKSIGRFEVQNAIFRALGLEKGLPL
jgi:hypothetical protein